MRRREPSEENAEYEGMVDAWLDAGIKGNDEGLTQQEKVEDEESES